MRPLLGFIFVFSAFTATGFSLTCKVCMGRDPSSCHGTSEICPADSACGAVHELTKKGGNQITEIYTISCVPLKECNTPGSISILEGKTLRGTSCCFTSHCFPSLPLLPGDDSQANGLYCGPCVTEGSNVCTPEEIVKCTGKEDMCLFQTAVTTGSQATEEVFRGCSTKTYCGLSKPHVIHDKVTTEPTYTCIPGKNLTDIHPGNSGTSHAGNLPLLVLSAILLLLLCNKW